jgi:acyl-CoA thioesterase I
MKWWVAVAIGLALASSACGRSEPKDDPPGENGRKADPLGRSPATPANVSRRARIVFLGDSLTIGLGLPIEQSYPSLLQERLKRDGLNYEVVNAGVSGDTSAGGLSRLDWALDGDVRILVVALGGNDGLRGVPPEALKQNLVQIIERAQARHVRVILAGMEAPPNYGRDYLVSFHKVYLALAQQYHLPFVPFLLQGVGGIERLNQPDGIHPTAEGARIVADNVWTVLEPVARKEARPES